MEDKFNEYVGSKYSTAVSNGTVALHLALLALGIGDGDEVVVPTFTYIASVNAIKYCGATPVFVDVEIDSFNIDATRIESAITPKTKAIIPVHEFGLPCDIEAIMKIANTHNLYIIEDAACALGASQNGKFVGTFGDFGSFSLHPRKAISSGEGGLITCQKPELAKKVQILRNHGIDIIDGKMEFVEAGFNYRMTDFQAALVNSQLARLKETLTYKNELANEYQSLITNSKIQVPNCPADRIHTWQTYHVLIDPTINRDELIKTLREKGIGTNYGAQNIPDQIYYKNKSI